MAAARSTLRCREGGSFYDVLLLDWMLPEMDGVSVCRRLPRDWRTYAGLVKTSCLFRDRQGRRGLIAETCPHRGASLVHGLPTKEGLRCPYHGWEFGHKGDCLSQPNEPEKTCFKDKVKVAAYPVEELGGMLFCLYGSRAAALRFASAAGWVRGRSEQFEC